MKIKLIVLVALTAHSLPLMALDSFSYSGRLVNSNGSPVTGEVNLRFDLSSTEDPNDILCSKTVNEVPLSQGIFNVKLDFLPADCENTTIQSIMENVASNHNLTYQVTDLTNSRTYSSQAIYSVPSSFMASFTKSLGRMGATTDGQVLKWNAATSKWIPGTVGSGNGTVTTINTGPGLFGGPIVNSGTISVAPGGITDSHLAAGINPAKLSGSRDATKYLKGDNTWSSFQADLLATILNGFSPVSGSAVTNSDSVLQAFGKLQSQVSDLETYKLDKTGGTLTGLGTIDGVPLPYLPSQIVNKQYVDDMVDGVNASQWITSAPHIYYNTGNVGIGTSTPNEKLQVAGNVALNGNLRLKDSGANYIELKAPLTTSGVTFTLPADAGTSGQALTTNGAGVLSWQNPSVSSADIADGSITNDDINGSANIDQAKIAGLTAALASKASDFGTGSAGEYLAGGRVWTTLNTDVVPEGSTRLYFTEPRVLGTDLAGFTTTVGTVTSADTVLSSIEKLTGNQANFVLKTGDSMSGDLLMGGNTVTGLGVPSAASDAATKAYVDSAAAAASPWTKTGTIVHYDLGNVGIGTATPRSKLDVVGGIQIGADPVACSATKVGTLRYDSTNIEYCNGSAWQAFGISGAGITSLNGSTSGTQSFASGTSGSAPAWSTAAGVHTLNIPFASASGVTAGLISKTDYDAFNGKLSTTTTLSGDVSGTYNLTSVDKIKGTGVAITSLTTGNLLRYNGTSWVNTLLGTTDIPALDAGKITSGTLPIARGGTGSTTADGALNNLLPSQAGNSGKYLSTNGTTTSWTSAMTPADIAPTYLVRVATNSSILLSGTQTIDGVAVAVGDRVLVKNQATEAANGVYLVAAGAWTRAVDLNSWADLIGYRALVLEGSAQAGLIYSSAAAITGTLGTTNIRFNSLGSSRLYDNTAIGKFALNGVNSGSDNIAIGAWSMYGATSAWSNTATGNYALQSLTTGYRNSAFGTDALLNNTNGYHNTALGNETLKNNTSGFNNTAVGKDALSSNTTGSNNTALGYGAGYAITTGTNNVVIGSNDGSTIATSSNNILISDGAGDIRVRINNSGDVGIGTNSPQSKLDIATTGTNSAVIVPRADSANRPTTPVNGMIRYNTTTAKFEGYQNGVWTNLIGSGTVTGVTGTAPVVVTGTTAPVVSMAQSNGTTNGYLSSTDWTTFNSKLGTTLTSTNIIVGNASNIATPVAASGDVTLANTGAFTVTKLQGRSVATTAPSVGSFLKWNNTLSNWEPTLFTNCNGTSQVLHYILLTDTWSCDNLSINSLLPSQAGNSGKFLSTNGTTTSWTTATSSPAGANTQIQFNNSGSFGASAGLVWDNVNGSLEVTSDKNAITTAYLSNYDSGTAAAAQWRIAGDMNSLVLRQNSFSFTPAGHLKSDGAVVEGGGNGGLSITASKPAGQIRLYTGGNADVNQRMTILSNGNVGIGTTNPGARLEVAGQVKVTGGTPGAGKVLTSDAAGLATWETPASGGDDLGNHTATQNIILGSNWINGDSGNEGISVNNFGQVKISNAVSQPMLAIESNSAGSDYLFKLDNNSNDRSYMFFDNTLNTGGIEFLGANGNDLVFGTESLTRMTISSTGKIGIGTSTPQAGLDIATTGTAASAVIVPRDTTANRPTTPVNGMIRYNTTTTKLEAYQAGAWVDMIAAASGSGFTQNGNSFGADAVLGTNDNFPLHFETSGATKMSLLANGNVGIGTTNPTALLEVNGTTKSNVVLAGSGTFGAPGFAFSGAPNYGMYQQGGNLSFSAGTTSSAFVITNFGTYVGSGNGAYFPINPGTAANTPALSKYSDSNTGIFFPAADNIGVSTGGLERMRINSTGNMGIGTTDPGTGTKLRVEGQISSKSFYNYYGDINWVLGNSGTTEFDCGTPMTMANMRDGGSYTLAVTGTGTTQCDFSTTTTGDDAATVTYRFSPANGARAAGSHTIYSFQRIGNIVYVSWITGF